MKKIERVDKNFQTSFGIFNVKLKFGISASPPILTDLPQNGELGGVEMARVVGVAPPAVPEDLSPKSELEFVISLG